MARKEEQGRYESNYSASSEGCFGYFAAPVVIGLVIGAYVTMAIDSARSYSPEVTKINLSQDDPYHMRISVNGPRPLQIAHPRIEKVLKEAEASCKLTNPVRLHGSTEVRELVLETQASDCSTKISKPEFSF